MMAHDNREIEIQVRVERIAPLLALMGKEGKYEGEVRQVDEYFTPAHKDYAAASPVNEWLRLRNEDGKFSISYKNYHRGEDGRALYCDEFETHIEAMDTMKRIFGALGMRPLITVEKLRRRWTYRDYEIAVDTVVGLGDFVEIEFNGATEDPKRTTSEMVQFLKGLDVGRIQRSHQGYTFSLLFPERIEYHDE